MGDTAGSTTRLEKPILFDASVYSRYAGEGPPLEDGFIEPSVPREQVRQDAYPLPKDFEWVTIDLNDPLQVNTQFILPHTLR